MAELTQSMSGRETDESILVGTCMQCGVCCERILLVEPDRAMGAEVDASASSTPEIVEIRQHLVVAYHRPDGIPVWRCTHLRWYGGKASCGIYQDRPRICRDFPLNNEGELPPGCSYRFVKRSRMLPIIPESQ